MAVFLLSFFEVNHLIQIFSSGFNSGLNCSAKRITGNFPPDRIAVKRPMVVPVADDILPPERIRMDGHYLFQSARRVIISKDVIRCF